MKKCNECGWKVDDFEYICPVCKSKEFVPAVRKRADYLNTEFNKNISTPNVQSDEYMYDALKHASMFIVAGENGGTASFVEYQGLIFGITNAHVVGYCRTVIGRFSSEVDSHQQGFSLDVVAIDAVNDVAILIAQVDMGMDSNSISFRKPLQLGNEADIRSGVDVATIGNPKMLNHVLTAGKISAVAQDNSVLREGANKFFANVTVAPGNSGGALVGRDGKMLGITTFMLKPLPGQVCCESVFAVRQLLNSYLYSIKGGKR